MENIGLYLIIILVTVFPTLLIQAFLNRESAPANNTVSNLPLFFRIVSIPVSLLEKAEIGKMLVAIFPQKAEHFAKQLGIANLKLSPAFVFSAQLFYSVALPVLAFFWCLVCGLEQIWCLLAAFVGLFIGFVLPSTIVDSTADKRQQEIIKSLPFAIDLIGSGMRSGLDFGAAVRYYVSLGYPGALTVEFGIMLRQIELGKNRVEALSDMSERICTKEFSSFVAAVAHSTETGSSLMDTLVIQGEEMRRSRFNFAERKAARAPSIMIIPMALFILPAVFIVIFVPVYLKVQASGMGAFLQ